MISSAWSCCCRRNGIILSRFANDRVDYTELFCSLLYGVLMSSRASLCDPGTLQREVVAAVCNANISTRLLLTLVAVQAPIGTAE